MRTSILIAAVLATIACNDKPTPQATATAVATAGSASSPKGPGSAAAADLEARAVDARLGAAIECINRASKNVGGSQQQYARGVDPKQGPEPKGKVWVGRIDQTACVKKLAEAVALKPAVADLDAAMAAYGKALEHVMPLANEATDYFEQGRHLDDGAAKGKELHPRLLASFDAFWAADAALRQVVQTRNRALKEADLARLAKDPALRGDHVRARMLLLAEDVLVLGKAPELAKIDAAGFAAKTAELDKAIADLTAYSTEVNSQDTTLDRRAGDFLKAALAMARRLREATPYDKYEKLRLSEGASDVDGSSPQLIAKYNELIGEANSSAARRR